VVEVRKATEFCSEQLTIILNESPCLANCDERRITDTTCYNNNTKKILARNGIVDAESGAIKKKYRSFE